MGWDGMGWMAAGVRQPVRDQGSRWLGTLEGAVAPVGHTHQAQGVFPSSSVGVGVSGEGIEGVNGEWDGGGEGEGDEGGHGSGDSSGDGSDVGGRAGGDWSRWRRLDRSGSTGGEGLCESNNEAKDKASSGSALKYWAHHQTCPLPQCYLGAVCWLQLDERRMGGREGQVGGWRPLGLKQF